MRFWFESECKTEAQRLHSINVFAKKTALDLLKKSKFHTLILASFDQKSAAWLLATFLKNAGLDPLIVCICQKNIEKRDVNVISAENFFLKEASLGWDLIIDGLAEIEENSLFQEMSQKLVTWSNTQQSERICLDMPAGWRDPSKAVFQAHTTYCFHTVKYELLSPSLRNFCGSFSVVDVGLKDPCKGAQIFMGDPAKELPLQSHTWHKYLRGSVYLATGSDKYKGSSSLGESELWRKNYRGSSFPGMVYTLLKPTHPQSVKWNLEPPKSEKATLVIGSGMSAEDLSLRQVFHFAHAFNAVVIDAGALDFLKQNPELWSLLPFKKTILTPHEGEARKLLSLSKLDSFDKLTVEALRFAKKKSCWFLLKNYVSYLFTPEGLIWIFPFNSPNLSVAGSGDRLAASIAGTCLHLPIHQAIALSMKNISD